MTAGDVVTLAACPVGELVGNSHTFVVGTGAVVVWDVLGDSRDVVEVCRSCVAVLSDCVCCNHCDGGPFPESAIEQGYDAKAEAFNESCPRCGEGDALAWAGVRA